MHNIHHDETDRNTQIKRAESDKTYDIYLLRGCQRLPDFGDLVQEAPMLADPVLLARIFPYYKRHPGFLGLDLSYARAAEVLQALKVAKADGYRIDAIYRHEPHISAEQAVALAKPALAELKAKRSNALSDPLDLRGEIPVCCWAFWAEIEEGRTSGVLYPGVLHVYVDKQDGHVWLPEEFERLYDDGTKRKTGISRVESERTYDIYLSVGCQTLPDFGDLVQEAPMLADPALLARIFPYEYGRRPGFLGFDLSYSRAAKVLQALKATKAGGYRVEAVYRRKPNITAEQAASIAKRAIAELKAKYSNVIFDPLKFIQEDLFYWEFGAAAPQWGEEGHIPGGLRAYVDKQDGHVWQLVEFDRLQEEEFLMLPSGRICDTQEFADLPREERRAIIAEAGRYGAKKRKAREKLKGC
jgi:hypothetical protein